MKRVLPLFMLALCLAGGSLLFATLPNTSTAAPVWTTHSVAFVGCSNTRMSAVGYYATPGRHDLLWNSALSNYNTDGGRLELWADPQSPYWQQFDYQVQHWYGQPAAVWVQLCEKYNSNPTDYAHVRSLFANLKQHAPNAVYYISAINVYDPITLCPWMGPNGEGVTDTEKWRDQAVADGLAQRGPDMGPLTASIVNNGYCHPNDAGEKLLGGELYEFFDTGAPPGPTSTPTATPTATPKPCTVRPARPVVISPINGARVNNTQVLLDWTNAKCAKKFSVVLKKGSVSGTVVERSGTLTNSQYMSTTLVPGKVYYWHVTACDSIGCINSRWWHFRVSASAAGAFDPSSSGLDGALTPSDDF